MERLQIQFLQTDRQTDVALTEQSVNQQKEKLQTASRQDITQESAICGQMETVLLKQQGTDIDRKTDIATTLMARDYKGFGTGFDTMNGVIEWKE